jgi:hypothetical protein
MNSQMWDPVQEEVRRKLGAIVFSDHPHQMGDQDFPFPALTLEERLRFELFGYTIVDDLFTEGELGSIEAAANTAREEILASLGDRPFQRPPPRRNTTTSKRVRSGGGIGRYRSRANFISTA